MQGARPGIYTTPRSSRNIESTQIRSSSLFTFDKAWKMDWKDEHNGRRNRTIRGNIDIHCFKKGVAIQEFIKTINEVSELSKKFGVPLGKLPEHLIELRAELPQLNVKIQAMKIQEREALKRSNLTLEIINEYQTEKPIVDRLKATQIELEKIENERDSIKKDRYIM